MYYKFHKQKQTEQVADEKTGVLRIEVPHWSAEVRVFNSLLQPEEIERIKSDAESKSGYSLETVLKPGIYQVQTSLEGDTESQWIPVNAGKITAVSLKAWEKLQFTSASPLKSTDDSNKTHSDKAVELSKRATWQYKNGGNSRLFLFVRTLNPKAYGETFSDGLQILDETGEIVTDFSEGVEKNKREGWMAFNADLPSGGYILRRGRSGVRVRQQVFYLCDGWETQIFVKAFRIPALGIWTLSMARRGSGFHPNSEAIPAAEAIIDNLRYNSNSLFLLQNEKIKESIDILLDEKIENPWLGILAAHAILRLEEQTQQLRLRLESLRSQQSSGITLSPPQLEEIEYLDKEISHAQPYFDILEQKVKPFLQRTIGEHPDVRALWLANDSPTDKPFNFPPSLMAGIQRVQAHSLLFTDTIPLNSLTDYVIDSLVPDSPWTSWRYIDRQPIHNLSPQARRLQVKQSGAEDFSVSMVLSQAAAPRTPVFHLAENEAQQTSTETVLQDAPLIQKAKEIVINYAKDLEMGNLPEKSNINSAEEINKILSQVTPEEISQNFGISLSRTEETLKILHSQASAGAGQSDAPMTPAKTDKSLVTVQQAILEYALNKFGKSERETTGAAQTLSKYTIREIVNKIQSEADRLHIAAVNSKNTESEIPFDFFRESADKLYAIAENLLKHTDFVLVTDARGKVQYSNGAFLLLISPKSDQRATMNEQDITDARIAKQREWETVLESAKNGLSDIENQFEPTNWRKWKLSRTEIEDDAANRTACYLNLLRVAGFAPLTEDTLQKIDSAAANLMFYTPLLVYSSGENIKENEKNLRETIIRLEEQVNNIDEKGEIK